MATQWFVACNPECNEEVAKFMATHGMGGDENLYLDMECFDKKKRDVWEIPGSFVQRLLDTRRKYPQFRFKLFKRNRNSGRLYSASFVQKIKRSKKGPGC